MDKKVIEKIQGLMALDADNQKDFVAYEDMDDVKFDFKSVLKPWAVPSISTGPTIALKTMANFFDMQKPRVRVVPFGQADVDRAERAERWIEYHFAKINQRGGKSPIRQLPHYAGKYGRICMQVDYLPYWLPKDKKSWTPEQKQVNRAGAYCLDIHSPRNVYYEMGKYGLRAVASITNLAPEEVIEHWAVYDDGGKNGKKIQAALKKVEAMYEENDEIRFIHVDYTDYEKRQVSLFETTGEDINKFEDFDEGTDRIDLLDAENKLGFLNWVVVEADSSPLLAPVHKGNLYAYNTMFDTIRKSTVMRRAFPPLIVSTTIDGEGVNIDYTGADPQINLKPGEQAVPFVPPPLDQAVFSISAEESARMEQALGVSKLAGMEASNVQYSTVSALIDLNSSNMEQYKRMTEKALEQAAYLMFKWVEYTKDSVTAFRTKRRTPEQPIGEEIIMSPESVGNADELLISVELTSKQDKVQAANRVTMLKQAQFEIPDAELLEELGFEDPDLLSSRWKDQQLKAVALQNLITELQNQVALKMKAAELQMQNQAQMEMQQVQMEQEAAMAPQDPNAQGAMGQMANPAQGYPSTPQGQGFNGAAGGTPPMMAEPGMTPAQR